MPSFDELIPSHGFLNDRQIRVALAAQYLIEPGTADDAQVRHASYTLRLGDRVELNKAQDSSHSKHKNFQVLRLGTTSPTCDLEPGDTALLYSMENLRIPSNVLCFTVARGLLFVESLSPENTYVDPGFAGTIYTTVTNVSSRVIRLTYGMSIARLFFYRLHEPAEHPYRSGAGMQISQQLETVPISDLGSDDQCSKASRAKLISTVKKIPMGGTHISELFERETKFLVRLFAWSTVWPILLVLVNTNDWLKNHLGSFLSNVLAGVVSGVLLIIAPWLYRRVIH
jgi:deoxycytidine triphosphate deaminase